MTDPTSRQTGRPIETIQQLSDNNLRTESNVRSQVSEWARYLDILTDWLAGWLTDQPSVVTWLRLRSVVPVQNDRWAWSIWWDENWQGKWKYKKTQCHAVYHKSHMTRSRFETTMGAMWVIAWVVTRPTVKYYNYWNEIKKWPFALNIYFIYLYIHCFTNSLVN
jgi:hypothetical protein